QHLQLLKSRPIFVNARDRLIGNHEELVLSDLPIVQSHAASPLLVDIAFDTLLLRAEAAVHHVLLRIHANLQSDSLNECAPEGSGLAVYFGHAGLAECSGVVVESRLSEPFARIP